MNEISKEEMMKARTAETMSSLLRDLTNMNISKNLEVPNLEDFKPWQSIKSKQDLDAEFTAARLLILKIKEEIDKAKEAETNLTDQYKLNKGNKNFM